MHVAIYSYVKTTALPKVLQGRAQSLCVNCKLWMYISLCYSV